MNETPSRGVAVGCVRLSYGVVVGRKKAQVKAGGEALEQLWWRYGRLRLFNQLPCQLSDNFNPEAMGEDVFFG